jgi:Concanavalin A-like lectin/glucanases superfamily
LGFNDGTAYRTVQGISPLPLNTWSHLAAVYDKQYLRLFVNGEQVAVRPYSGALATSTGALRIGGNSIWGDYFKGLIDEVKIYRSALIPSELQTDMKTALFVSKPKQILIGSNQKESSVDSNPQNVAEAFSIVAAKTGVLTRLDVYLDEGSATSGITAGIYTDNKGHPGKLLTKGKINTTKTNATNAVAVPAAQIEAGKTYWLAVICPNGVIKFRDRMGQAGGTPMETSASSTLTTLPLYWTTGQTYSDGPMSVYGSGY